MTLIKPNKKLCKQVILVMQIVLFILLFTNCKKTEVAGRIYSKYNTPVANANIRLVSYHSSKYAEDDKIITTSDENGYYSFKFKPKNHRDYYIRCLEDSGYTNTETIVLSKVNHFDLKFK
jgi:hypothetical protein